MHPFEVLPIKNSEHLGFGQAATIAARRPRGRSDGSDRHGSLMGGLPAGRPGVCGLEGVKGRRLAVAVCIEETPLVVEKVVVVNPRHTDVVEACPQPSVFAPVLHHLPAHLILAPVLIREEGLHRLVGNRLHRAVHHGRRLAAPVAVRHVEIAHPEAAEPPPEAVRHQHAVRISFHGPIEIGEAPVAPHGAPSLQKDLRVRGESVLRDPDVHPVDLHDRKATSVRKLADDRSLGAVENPSAPIVLKPHDVHLIVLVRHGEAEDRGTRLRGHRGFADARHLARRPARRLVCEVQVLLEGFEAGLPGQLWVPVWMLASAHLGRPQDILVALRTCRGRLASLCGGDGGGDGAGGRCDRGRRPR
mmetsp:Transcript_79479/g.207297  ORF Transcript_79479/g.207297 Transcript_79479/m.207297 type:complete len:360 (+) Transcript_79479:201-1280(+)